MKVSKISLENKPYPLKYGYGALRNLGDLWDCKGVQGVAKRFEEVFNVGSTEDITFEQGDMLGDVVIAGIENAGVLDYPEREDIVQELLFDSDKLTYVIEGFTASFGKQEDLGKGKPRKQTRKKPATKKKS